MERISVEYVIKEIKTAVCNTNRRLKDKGIKISEIELMINTIFYSSPGVEANINLGVFQLGVDFKDSNSCSNQIKISFVPEESQIELLGELERNLSAGVEMILIAIDNGKRKFPEFGFKNGEVEVGFVVTEENKISLIFKNEKNSEEIHRVKLKIEYMNNGS